MALRHAAFSLVGQIGLAEDVKDLERGYTRVDLSYFPPCRHGKASTLLCRVAVGKGSGRRAVGKCRVRRDAENYDWLLMLTPVKHLVVKVG